MTDRNKVLSLAFYGISHPHSSARFRSAAERPDVRIVGAYDDSAETLEAFCSEVGTTALTERAILEDSAIDAVFVHSKSSRMSQMALRAIAAQKHVLVEKPGGANASDLANLAKSAAASDVIVRVGYNFHFAPTLLRAREALDTQQLGKISLVHGHGACSMDEHLSDHLNQDKDMGGGLWVIGVHVLHLILDLIGPPKEVRATVVKLDALSDSRSREDLASLTLIYEDKIATFDFTVHENSDWFESSKVSVYGDSGRLSFDVLPGRIDTLDLSAKNGPSGWESWSTGSFVTPWTGPKSTYSELPQVGNRFFFDSEIDEFITAAKGKKTSGGASALMAYHVAAVVAAAYESASLGGISTPVAPP